MAKRSRGSPVTNSGNGFLRWNQRLLKGSTSQRSSKRLHRSMLLSTHCYVYVMIDIGLGTGSCSVREEFMCSPKDVCLPDEGKVCCSSWEQFLLAGLKSTAVQMCPDGTWITTYLDRLRFRAYYVCLHLAHSLAQGSMVFYETGGSTRDLLSLNHFKICSASRVEWEYKGWWSTTGFQYIRGPVQYAEPWATKALLGTVFTPFRLGR